FIVENSRSFFIREVAISNSAVGDRTRDAMNQLPHRGFSSAFIWIGAVGNVPIKVFRHCNFGRERAPVFRNFDILLLKNDFAAVVIDFRCPPVPFDLIEWHYGSVAERALKTQTGIFCFLGPHLAVLSWFRRSFKRGGRNSGFQLNHGSEGGLRFRIRCEYW